MFRNWRTADFDKQYGWQKKSKKVQKQIFESMKQLYGRSTYAKDGERETANGTAGTDIVCHVDKEAGI